MVMFVILCDYLFAFVLYKINSFNDLHSWQLQVRSDQVTSYYF
jgi:hypothetical protein